jgi:hypothetical protein
VTRALPAVVVAGAYALVTLAITWPIETQLSTVVIGDPLDPTQSVWNFWWWRQALSTGTSPFRSDLLWWPNGISLWFQTWDLPSLWMTLPLAPWLSDMARYNLAVLLSFPLSGYTAYWLCLELWPGSRLAAALAGCLYTFSTYHYAHAQMHLHVASMQWTPLFILGLVRLANPQRQARPAILLTAIGLALAFLSSVYHALFGAIVAGTLLCTRGFGDPRTLLSMTIFRRSAGAAAVFALLAGWLAVGMALDFYGEPFAGGHDSVRFSADLASFVVPNALSLWAPWFPSSSKWTGTAYESASYVGIVGLALAIFAGWKIERSRPYLWVAAVGAILAIGPFLHVNGVVARGLTLPEGWLEQLVPPLRFSGIPARYSWLTTFGVAIAAGATLNRLCLSGMRGRIIATALVAVAMLETWPKPFVTASLPDVPALEALSHDLGQWAVLDLTIGSRPLWHQMLHKHPIVAGYTTRTPERLWSAAADDPVLGALLPPPVGRGSGAVDFKLASDTLHSKSIRYVIVDERHELPAALPLTEVARGQGVGVYEVR